MLYEKSFKIQILQKLSTNEPPRSLENFPEGTKDLVCDILIRKIPVPAQITKAQIFFRTQTLAITQYKNLNCMYFI